MLKALKKALVKSRLVRFLIKNINSILLSCGYKRLNVKPIVDFQGIDLDNQIPAMVEVKNNIQILVDVDLKRLRDIPPITPPMSLNPFYLIALKYIESGDRNKATNVAEKWYDIATLPNAAAVLDIFLPNLIQMEPLMARLPWEGVPGPGEKIVRLKRAERQARQYNLNLTGEDGDYAMGPLSPAKIAFETARICDLVDSIKKNGYQVEHLEDHINCRYIMVDQKDPSKWCMMIKSGTHRLAVLMALGWEKFPILIEKGEFVKKSEVDTWLGVRKGVVSAEDALKIFDRVLNNELPQSLDVLDNAFAEMH